MTDVLSELHHQIDECSIVEIKLFVKRVERFEGIKQVVIFTKVEQYD